MYILKPLWLFLIALFLAINSNAQATIDFEIDHYAINVADLQKSVDFYQNVFGLVELPNGTANPNIRWFRLGKNAELHIIQVEGLDKKVPKGVHLALAVSDFDSFRESLVSKNISYSDWPGKKGAVSLRPDGIRQLYLQDIDGYYIEVNDAKH